MTEVEQMSAPQNGIDLSAAEDDESSKARPADIEQDMREMERRKRVEAIMGSKLFREELERIVDSAREGGASGILQQLSDIVGIPCTRVGSVFKASNCMSPINDIRGVESMGYAKGEKILRCKLAATFRLLDLYGWTQGLGAQITARLKVDQEYFLVNPYGMMYHEITASSLNKVDMQGQIVEQGTTNFGVNKSHFMLHSVIHAARPDIRCAIYIGCSPVVAVSSLKTGILPLTKDACVLGEITTHAYTGSLDTEERDKLVRNLGPNSKIMLLSNHGALCCGETIEEAFYSACHIVQACETQLKLLPVGIDNLVLISEDARKHLYEQSRRPPEDLEKKFAAAVSTQDETTDKEDSVVVTTTTTTKVTSSTPKWRVGGAEFEALMRMLDNAGYRTGYIYRHPLIKSEPPKPKNDVELPPAVSSLGYLLEEEELFRQGIWKKGEIRKGGDRSRWLNSPNVYQKVEVLETGTPDPKKITKWVAEGSPTHSTAVRIEDPLQFVPAGTNPKEFKRLQQQIKDNRRADKISAGPQSHILEGVTWDEANRIKDATVSQAGDHVVLMGAASKGIIQRGFQHNATVYKAPYAKNPFDNVTDDELNEYKRTVERKKKSIHGEYTDTDFSESEALSSQQTSGAQHTKQTTTTTTAQAVSQSEPEDISEHQVMRIETQQAPIPSQPEVVLSDATLSFINGERSHTVTNRKPPTGREQIKNEQKKFNFQQVNEKIANTDEEFSDKENIHQGDQNIHNKNTPDKMQTMKDKLLFNSNSNLNSALIPTTVSSSTNSTDTASTIWQTLSTSNNKTKSTNSTTTNTPASCNKFVIQNIDRNRNGCSSGSMHNVELFLNSLIGLQNFQQQLQSGTEDLTSTRVHMHSPVSSSKSPSSTNLFQYEYYKSPIPTATTTKATSTTTVNSSAFVTAATMPQLTNDGRNAVGFIPQSEHTCCNASCGFEGGIDQTSCPTYYQAANCAQQNNDNLDNHNSHPNNDNEIVTVNNNNNNNNNGKENAYKKSVLCRTPNMCDYIFDVIKQNPAQANNLIFNIPFRVDGGCASTVASSVTGTPRKSRCDTPYKRREQNQGSSYRTVSHFGFQSPQSLPKPEHKHIPIDPKKYVPLRRSISYEEIFSSPRYMDLCENCFERLVRIKPEIMLMRSRLQNLFEFVKKIDDGAAAVDNGVDTGREPCSVAPLTPIDNELYTTAMNECALVRDEVDDTTETLSPFGLQLDPVVEEDELLADASSSSTAVKCGAQHPERTVSNSTFIGQILRMNFSNESTNINYAPHTVSSNISIDVMESGQDNLPDLPMQISSSSSSSDKGKKIETQQRSAHSLHSVKECTNFMQQQQHELSPKNSRRSSPSAVDLEQNQEQEQYQNTVSIAETLDFGNWPSPLPQTDDEDGDGDGNDQTDDDDDPVCQLTESSSSQSNNGTNERQSILSQYLTSNSSLVGRDERRRRKLLFNELWDNHIAFLDGKIVNLNDNATKMAVPNETNTDNEQKSERNIETTSPRSLPSGTESFHTYTMIRSQEHLPALNSDNDLTDDPPNSSNASYQIFGNVSATIRNQLDGIEALLKQTSEIDDDSSSDRFDDVSNEYICEHLSSGFLNVIFEESEEEEYVENVIGSKNDVNNGIAIENVEEINMEKYPTESVIVIENNEENEFMNKNKVDYEMKKEHEIGQYENNEIHNQNIEENQNVIENESEIEVQNKMENKIDHLHRKSEENEADIEIDKNIEKECYTENSIEIGKNKNENENENFNENKKLIENEAEIITNKNENDNSVELKTDIDNNMNEKYNSIENETGNIIDPTEQKKKRNRNRNKNRRRNRKEKAAKKENESIEREQQMQDIEAEQFNSKSTERIKEAETRVPQHTNSINNNNREEEQNKQSGYAECHVKELTEIETNSELIEKVINFDSQQVISNAEITDDSANKMKLEESDHCLIASDAAAFEGQQQMNVIEETRSISENSTAIETGNANEYDENEGSKELEEYKANEQVVADESRENSFMQQQNNVAAAVECQDDDDETECFEEDNNPEAALDADDEMDFISHQNKQTKKALLKSHVKIDLVDTDDTDANKANTDKPQDEKISSRRGNQQLSDADADADADDERGDSTGQDKDHKQQLPLAKNEAFPKNLAEQANEKTSLVDDADRSDATIEPSRYKLSAQSLKAASDSDIGIIGAPRRVYSDERLSGGYESSANSISQQKLLYSGVIVRRDKNELSFACETHEEIQKMHVEQVAAEDCSEPSSNDGSGDGIPRTSPMHNDEVVSRYPQLKTELFFRETESATALTKYEKTISAFTICGASSQIIHYYRENMLDSDQLPTTAAGHEREQEQEQEEEEQENFDMQYVFDDATQRAELKYFECMPTAAIAGKNNSDEMLAYNIPLVTQNITLFEQVPSESEIFDNTSATFSQNAEKVEQQKRNTGKSPEKEVNVHALPEKEEYICMTEMKDFNSESFSNTLVTLNQSPLKNSKNTSKSPEKEEYICMTEMKDFNSESFSNTLVTLNQSPLKNSKKQEVNVNVDVLPEKEEYICVTEMKDFNSERFCNTFVTLNQSPLKYSNANGMQADEADFSPLERQVLDSIEEGQLAQKDEIFAKIEMTIRNKLTPSKLEEMLKQNNEILNKTMPLKTTTNFNKNQVKVNLQQQCTPLSSHANKKKADIQTPRKPLRPRESINITVSNISTPSADTASSGKAKKRNFILENIRNASAQRNNVKRLKSSPSSSSSGSPFAASNGGSNKANNYCGTSPKTSDYTDVFTFQSNLVRGSPSFWVSLAKTPTTTPRKSYKNKTIRSKANRTVFNSQIKKDSSTSPHSYCGSNNSSFRSNDGNNSGEIALKQTESSLTLTFASNGDSHVDDEIAALGEQIDAIQPRLATYKNQIDNYGENIADCANCIDECIDLQNVIAQQHQELCQDMRMQQYAEDISCQIEAYSIDAGDD